MDFWIARDPPPNHSEQYSDGVKIKLTLNFRINLVKYFHSTSNCSAVITLASRKRPVRRTGSGV